MAENGVVLSEPNPHANEIRQQNRLYLIKQKDNNDVEFEKNHVYISVGTLAISVTFIEKLHRLKKLSVSPF